MKALLPLLVLAASVASVGATATEIAKPRLAATSTTTYGPGEPFYHVAGGAAYVGLFTAKPGACSIWVQSGPAPIAAQTAKQQVEVNLPAHETLTFLVSDEGAALNLHCAADGQSLAVDQTWSPPADASALPAKAGKKL